MSYHRFEPEKSWCILKRFWCIAEIIITHKVSCPGYKNNLCSILHQCLKLVNKQYSFCFKFTQHYDVRTISNLMCLYMFLFLIKYSLPSNRFFCHAGPFHLIFLFNVLRIFYA
jgi:hypothetical protein